MLGTEYWDTVDIDVKTHSNNEKKKDANNVLYQMVLN